MEAKTGRETRPAPPATIRVKDEVWIATALLHREHPDRLDFTSKEIAERARHENVFGSYRPGVYVHINLHCVANRRRNPARLRFLFATAKARRRLFRPGDPYHPAREGGPTCPDRDDVPARYQPLLDWYQQVYAASDSQPSHPDPILALRGLGKEAWGDEEPDAYVRRLREGWP